MTEEEYKRTLQESIVAAYPIEVDGYRATLCRKCRKGIIKHPLDQETQQLREETIVTCEYDLVPVTAQGHPCPYFPG